MSKTRKAGEFSSPWLCVSRSNSDGCSGLNSAACEMRRQKSRSAVLRAVAPADGHAVGHDGGVHGAGAGRADALELDRLLLEQAVEHAPGEGAVRAAALEGEVDGPDPARERPGFEGRDIDVLVHGILPFSGRSSRRRPAARCR